MSPEIRETTYEPSTPKKMDEWLKNKGIKWEFSENELKNIDDLGLDFKKEGNLDPKEVDKKISTRFYAEIQKAWISSNTPGLTEKKEEFNKLIEWTTSMEEKLKLYSSFIDVMRPLVATDIAEQKQWNKQNRESMEKITKDDQKNTADTFEKKLKNIHEIAEEIKKLERKEKMRQTDKEREEKKSTVASIDRNLSFAFGPPGKEMPQTKNS